MAGKLVLTSGLGGMGGAQPLAITMADGVAICIEVDLDRIKKRIHTKYLDTYTDSIDEAIKLSQNALRETKAFIYRSSWKCFIINSLNLPEKVLSLILLQTKLLPMMN